MALVWIDGKEIEVRNDETLLKAALRQGIYIPYFCYHPILSIVGQCRMCLVKVEGLPKLITACTTYVSELPKGKKIDGKYDLKVYVDCEEVKEAQKGIMEFLLLNHPLDCPICDQAGECQLQIYSYNYGKATSEFRFEKLTGIKRYELGPHVIYDSERCIRCSRCIRFCNEITKTGELTFVERGAHTYVDHFEGKKLDNPYSICTVDLCPVGALTFKEFRFKERVWFLRRIKSICGECATNCSIFVDTYKGDILRIVPRENENVNGYIICDYGRLVFERIKDKEKRNYFLKRESGVLKPIKKSEFFKDFLGDFLRKYKKEEIAVILSGRMTNEEFFAYKIFSLLLFGENIGVVLNVKEEGDEILRKSEARPNYCGAKLLGFELSEENFDLYRYFDKKRILFIIRENIFKHFSKEKIEEIRNKMEKIVVFEPFLNETAIVSDYYIPLTNWFEMDGTSFNFDYILQRINKCVTPPAGREPFYRFVSELMKAIVNIDEQKIEGIERVEEFKKVLNSFKEREIVKNGGFKDWFYEFRKAISGLQSLEIKEIGDLGYKYQVNRDGSY